LRRVKMRRRRGRRARAKKMGPPWWWMGESMRCGPRWVQRSPRMRMRKALRKMARGKTKAMTRSLWVEDLRKRWEAMTEVMRRIQEERMPEHSWATSMVMVGSLKRFSERRKGVSEREKSHSTTSAEASLEMVSRDWRRGVGMGMAKRRKVRGKEAADMKGLPRKRKPRAKRARSKERQRMEREDWRSVG